MENNNLSFKPENLNKDNSIMEWAKKYEGSGVKLRGDDVEPWQSLQFDTYYGCG